MKVPYLILYTKIHFRFVRKNKLLGLNMENISLKWYREEFVK